MSKKDIRIDSVNVKWEPDESRTVGCRAVATVSYVSGRDGDRRLEWLTSGGLYGIDAASTPEYRKEIELDELSDLRDHLEAFGIDCRDFAARFAPALQR